MNHFDMNPFDGDDHDFWLSVTRFCAKPLLDSFAKAVVGTALDALKEKVQPKTKKTQSKGKVKPRKVSQRKH